MDELQIENKIVGDVKENKHGYDREKYAMNAKKIRKVQLEYYHANKEKIAASRKRIRDARTNVRPKGRPKKYVDECSQGT